jgi:Holliday junction resolvasome RuvABC endonuclease subunit
MILALDLSLTATGWASETGSGVLVPPGAASRGVARLRWIRDAVLGLARGAELVVLEGYAFGARGRAVVSLGELGGAVRVALADAGIPWVDVPPTCRALFAAGRGNAPKDAVLAAAIRTLGYAGHDHNEADAMWLLTMARTHYAGDVPPEPRRRALAGVAWLKRKEQIA